MTRNGDGDRIGGAGAGDCPDGARFPNRRRELTVRSGLAVRNRGECLPHLPLEGGGLNVERQIDSWRLALGARQQFLRPRRLRIGRIVDCRRRVFTQKLVFQLNVRRSHLDRADASRC